MFYVLTAIEKNTGCSSSVERSLWEREAVGSIPSTPTLVRRMKKSLFDYYLRGFALANKSFTVYFITLVLLLPNVADTLIPKLPFPRIISLVSYIVGLIGFAFSLSIPVFLLQKQQKESSSLYRMLIITAQTTKRIIFPIILIVILFLLIVLASIVFAVIFHLSREQSQYITDSIIGLNKGWHPLYLILISVYSLFTFTSFFFVLEQKGLIISMKDSFLISFRHIPYLSIATLLGVICYLVTSFLPITELWGLCLRYVISLYVGLVVASSTLFYYQEVVKTK